jgi:thiamine-monophosphate kinase
VADEFDWIASLRPLTRGDPRALELLDDAAVLPARTGQDLVISVDTMVEGVHFLADERPDVVARRLLRTSLSDLAAKAARPFGYFLSVAWPDARPSHWRDRFREGLAQDGDEFGVALLGGDTVATPGPLTVSATVLGWVETGCAVLRSTAGRGDAALVCGVVGDGWLGLRAARGELQDAGGRLASHYRTPRPLLALRELLSDHAHAAADVSDGLLADFGHIAAASGLAVNIELDRAPLSLSASAWRANQPDEAAALMQLATGGDDYAIACAVAPAEVDDFRGAAAGLGIPAAVVGAFEDGEGVRITFHGREVAAPGSLGWRH